MTHHRDFDPPSTVEQALAAVLDFLAPPVRVLSETPLHSEVMRSVLQETRITGNLVHDPHLVALALEHGVHEILTTDGDFRRFT